MESNRIEKRIELKAPVSRVWRALTDYREFGEWFKVKLDEPFIPGQVSRGRITYPGYEHVTWEARIEAMEPERLFSFYWPHAQSFEKTDKPADYSNAPRTLVEFHWNRFRGVHCSYSPSPASTAFPPTGAPRHSVGTTAAGPNK